MSLPPGTRIGAYEILALIGEGGMGQVYRAMDTRLGRSVAIKILPEAFAADADRLARFEREARTLAALNHPNIAHIHGLEETPPSGTGPGLRALVMELVEGDDLSARIAHGPVPLGDALPIARQIALALEAAHEQGIIHRDLKPANIKVTADGTVKVLDFGLAKAMDSAGASGGATANAMKSPTLTARATELGLILGTAAYMAPEQARGKAVDRRADIWSFGVVLTELLTGERAFKGEDITEVLAKVIERDPDFSKLPAATPPGLRRLLARCLTKDPKQRLRDIGEARIMLDETAEELARGQGHEGREAGGGREARPRQTWQGALPWIIAAASLAVAAYAWTRTGPASGVPGTPTSSSAALKPSRLQIALPAGIDLYTAVGASLSMSSDGTTLAFIGVRRGVRQVFLRQFETFDVTPVRGSEGAVSCIFSPDGREVLVGWSDTSLRRFRLADGLTSIVARSTSDYMGSWLPDGRIVYSAAGRLWVTGASADAAPTQITQPTPDSTAVETNAAAVPGANAILFVSSRPDAPDSTRIEALTLSDLRRTVVVERAYAPVVASPGHLLFLRDGNELAVRFDSSALRIIGDAVPVLRDMTIVRNRGVSPVMTVSRAGTLVYASAATSHSELVSVTRRGEETTLLSMERAAANPRVSPDGRRVLFEEIGGGLWLYDVERRTESRLTDGSALASFPLLGVGGRDVIYRSPVGLFRRPLDGSARAAQIAGTGPSEFPSGLSPDGAHLVYAKLDSATAADIYHVPLAGGTPQGLVTTPAYEGGGQISPDGRWMVYVSNELGPSEIFVQAYPKSAGRKQVSSAGGIHPTWNPKGGEIFYRAAEDMMSVRFSVGPAGPVLAPPVRVFSGRYGFGGGVTIANYAVMPDGDRFVMVKEPAHAILNVVLNWFEDLRGIK